MSVFSELTSVYIFATSSRNSEVESLGCSTSQSSHVGEKLMHQVKGRKEVIFQKNLLLKITLEITE